MPYPSQEGLFNESFSDFQLGKDEEMECVFVNIQFHDTLLLEKHNNVPQHNLPSFKASMGKCKYEVFFLTIKARELIFLCLCYLLNESSPLTNF